ncbi:MAG: hypothetical protein JNM90_24450, partial [Burkholderiales bacterium]|nr:hypothetical protein [Burkholderiales bacterium]
MEEYFAQLKAVGKLPEGAAYNVSGYSLGGHLATVFAENHADDPLFRKAYIFNGAGRGALVDTSLTQAGLVGLYRQVVATPVDGLQAVLARLRAAGMVTPQLALKFAGYLDQAISIQRTTAAYDFRTDGSVSGASIYGTRRHDFAMAVLDPLMDSAVWVSLFGGAQISAQAAAKIVYLFGNATHDDNSMTANGAITVPSDQRQWLFIEDQPNWYGDGGFLGLNARPGYTSGDFLRTHSITLLADSLALMNLFSRADGSLTKLQIETIFAAASSERAAGTWNEASTTAESDSLENALFALEKALSPDPEAVRRTGVDRSGDGFGNLTLRETFHLKLRTLTQRLDALAGGAAAASGLTIVPLIGMNWVPLQRAVLATGLAALTVEARPLDVEQVIAKARQPTAEGMAYRFALRHGSPFVVLGTDVAAQNRGGELDLHSAANRAGMTAEYIENRARYLAWRLKHAVENVGASVSPDGKSWLMRDAYQLPAVILADGQTRFEHLVLALPADSAARDGALAERMGAEVAAGRANVILFGSAAAEALAGGGGTDRLFGDGGADVLEGQGGVDYLEGGSGLDVYQFNGATTLLGTETDDGSDTVRDSDGRGLIRYSHSPGSAGGIIAGTPPATSLVAGFFAPQAGAAGTWKSLDGAITLTRQAVAGGTDLAVTFNAPDGTARPGAIRIRDWREGDLQIRLLDGGAAAAPATARLVLGDRVIEDANPATPEIDGTRDALGNWRRSAVEAPDQADLLFGGRPAAGAAADARTPGDRIVAGGGNDVIHADRPGSSGVPQPDDGRGDADWIVAGSGRDVVEAGAADDLIEGGSDGTAGGAAGGDVIDAGAGDDAVFGGERVELAQAIVDGDRETYPANPRAPVLASGLPGDYLAGGAGDDLLVGGSGNDVIATGAGRDTAVGGAGDDTIVSSDYRAQGLGWSIDAFATAFVPGTVEGRLRAAGRPLGRRFVGTAGEDEPQPGAQAPGKAVHAGSGADWVSLGNGDDFIDAGSGDDIAGGGAGDDLVIGAAGADLLLGEDGADVLDGGAGDDALFGGAGGDLLFGGAGRDVLEGFDGDDILVGGPGDDVLAGGAGRDTYVFRRGDGVEVIADPDDLLQPLPGETPAEAAARAAAKSVIVLGAGIARSEIRFRKGSLLIDLGQGDALHLEMAAGDDDPAAVARFARLEFADGSSLDFAAAMALGFDIDGTARSDDSLDADGNLVPGHGGNDVLTGTSAADRMRGFSGDDALSGRGGADVLDGGAGNDVLDGGAGDDTYAFAAGDGADLIRDGDGVTTLSFGPGIGAADLTAQARAGFDARLGRFAHVLSIGYGAAGAASGSVDLVDGLAHGRTRYAFADGSVLSQEALLARVVTPLAVAGGAADDLLAGGGGDDVLEGNAGDDALAGGAGADRLHGGDGDDRLAGGAGADQLAGGAGNDTYLFGPGSGIDLVEDDAGETLIRVGGGLGAADLDARLVSGSDGALYARFDAAPGDVLLVRLDTGLAGAGRTAIAFDDGSAAPLEQVLAERLAGPVRFQGGTTAVALAAGRFDDVLYGSSAGDRLDGGAGADALYGDDGADELHGGTDDDLVIGGGGDDVLAGGAGADTYELRRGMGRDLIIDAGDDGINRLVLAPGVELAALSAERRGDDLHIGLGGDDDTLVLAGHFVQSGAWHLADADGAGTTLEAFLANAAPPPAAASVEDARARFAARLTQAFETSLAVGGYLRQADGSWRREALEGSVHSRHEIDTVVFGSAVEDAGDDADYRQATPALQRLATSVARHESEQTVTVTDTAAATFVGLGGSGLAGVAGTVAGQFVTDFPYVTRSGALVALSSGPATPVFGTTAVARSAPPQPGQSIGGLEKPLVGFFVHGTGAGGDAGLAGTGGGAGTFQPPTQTRTELHVRDEVRIEQAVNLVRIDGGTAANRITVAGHALVDAGAGDDLVR